MNTFLSAYESRRISFDEFIRQTEENRCHSFSPSVLFSYFKLHDAIMNQRVFFFDGLVIIDMKKTVAFQYDMKHEYDFTKISREIDVYAKEKIPALRKYFYIKREEVLYELEKVLSPDSYPTRERRKKCLMYPLNRVEKAGFKHELLKENFAAMEEVFSKWSSYKDKTLQVFKKMTFQANAYVNAARNSYEYRKYCGFLSYVGFIGGKPFSVECYGISGNMAYGISTFNLFFEYPSNYSEGSELMSYRFLRENGIKYMNSGFSLNKDLKSFKAQWPHEFVNLYQYRIKKDAEATVELF